MLAYPHTSMPDLRFNIGTISHLWAREFTRSPNTKQVPVKKTYPGFFLYLQSHTPLHAPSHSLTFLMEDQLSLSPTIQMSALDRYIRFSS